MRSLWFKLMGSFAAVIVVTLGVVTLVVSIVAAQQLDLYVERSGRAVAHQIAPVLAESYRVSGDWRGAQTILTNPSLTAPPRRGDGQGQGMMGTGTGAGMMSDPRMMHEMGFEIILADLSGEIVAGTDAELVGEVLAADVLVQGSPVSLGGGQIGTLLVVRSAEDSPARTLFLAGVQRAVIFAGIAAGLAALLMGTLLFQRIIQPLRHLQSAAHRVAEGDLGARVPVGSDDEIADLAAAFNQMAANLSQQQDLRKQMVADIAHELRNPISVMQATLEAMQDGLIQPSQQELDDLYDDVRRLARLVEDLRTLSLADAGQLTLLRDAVDPAALVTQAAGRMSGQAAQRGVTLTADAPTNLPLIDADEDRLVQVLGNLIDNALRHTRSGGKVTVRARQADHHILFEVADTGPGIDGADLPYVFERFWRGDKSRSRESGGSGLGLAIVRQLVEMHGGTVEVDSKPGEGAVFRAILPAAGRDDSPATR